MPLVAATIAYLGLAAVAMRLTGWPLVGMTWVAKAALLMAMLLALELTGLLRLRSIMQPRTWAQKGL
jgi:hypothetical protein